MSQDEARRLLEYAMMLYPSYKRSGDQLKREIALWASKFRDDSYEDVGTAYDMASEKSPEFPPSLPLVKATLIEMGNCAKKRSPDDDFRDSHGGKSESEWNAYLQWSSSESGKEQIERYKQRLKEILGE